MNTMFFYVFIVTIYLQRLYDENQRFCERFFLFFFCCKIPTILSEEIIIYWPVLLLYSTKFLARCMVVSQPTFTCSKLTSETLEQGVKYVQS